MTTTTLRRTVVVESPFEGGTPREADNVVYLRRCLRDCFRRGEAPFASHGLYPGVLDDTVADERALGIECGWAIAYKLDAWVWYLDRGVTRGMVAGLECALMRVNVPSLAETTLFRSFGLNEQAIDLDPVVVMRKHPALAQMVLRLPGLAEAWKIGHSG